MKLEIISVGMSETVNHNVTTGDLDRFFEYEWLDQCYAARQNRQCALARVTTR